MYKRQVLDLTGKVVLPGFVDAHSHVGIWGDGEGRPAYDGNEMSAPVVAQVNALDATNPVSYTHLDVYKRQIYDNIMYMVFIF